MDSNDKKRILLLISNSYAATNIIHSGLIKLLAEEYKINIISDMISDGELAEINHHFKIKTSRLNIALPSEKWFIRLLRRLEKAVFFHYFGIETQKIKYQQEADFYNPVAETILNILWWIGLSKKTLKLLRKSIILFTQKNTGLTDLQSFQFSGVISTSPLDIRENTVVNYLKTMGIPSFAIVISWDNLTSKGVMNADHDEVQVWNQLMAEEYQAFYSVFGTRQPKLRIAGVPKFDIYYKNQFYSNSVFREKFKLPLSGKIILFATSAAVHAPYQNEILKHLTEYAAQKQNISIVVRCHPADDCDNYDHSDSPVSVKICPPEKFHIPDAKSGRLPHLDTLQNLAEMLNNCDVCIQIASTIRLEAAICNKPIVSIAYDGEHTQPFRHSVKRFYFYSHQLPLNSLRIDHMVFNRVELFSALDEILYSLQFIPNDNSRKMQSFIPQPSSGSVYFTMKGIREWLN